MKKTIFLSILCIIFLNLSCLAKPSDKTRDFVPPLILSDYNTGTLFTDIGTLSGGDEDLPGTTFAVIVSDDGYTKGNSGYSVMLDYDVSGMGDYSFYWIKLGKELPSSSGITERLDVSKYNYLSFWIKGADGDEKIKLELHQDVDRNGMFVFGTDLVSSLYVRGFLPEGRISRNWQKALIPLDKFRVISNREELHELVLVFENYVGNTKGKVFIDRILFGWRPEKVLEAQKAQALTQPEISTFRVNGQDARQCLAFERANTLSINAECIKDNPFIESVAFQYSLDGGKTWRTIGRDFDVSDSKYSVEWFPKDTSGLHNYQVRAVATDIKGNENATTVLIDCGVKPLTDEEFLNLIEKEAFLFFLEHQDLKTGLFADTSGGGDASIASSGFGVTALCVGAERGWISREQAARRAVIALSAFLPNPETGKTLASGKYGFFYHFLNMHTGKRAGKSEISTVDTALLVCGALTAGEYFGGEIKEKAEAIYKNVEWGEFLSQEGGPWQNIFSMGWAPERGFLDSYWDYYTDEVILISLLAIGSPTYPVDPEAFYAWTRQTGSYKEGKPFIYSWHGALFSYQYANVWFDFRDIVDRNGVNWFENSKNATIANREFCIDNQDKSKTYGPNSWGITSMARPEAYTMHFGVPPMGSGEPKYDGTISPTGPAGSITFTPFLSLSALKYMYKTYPRLWGQYGLRDSYDLDNNWYAPTYYGIGVALMVMPIENFRSGFVWKTFMKNGYIQEALKKAGFKKR